MKNIRFLSAILFLTACLASPTVWGKDRPELLTSGMCDGLPRLPVTTMAGFYVGLVAQGFDFPRGVLPLPSGDVLVVDMGGWGPKRAVYGGLPIRRACTRSRVCFVAWTDRMES